ELGVHPESFEPTYVVTETKAKGLSRILGAARGADAIYLATDPDREGEAIADQLAALIKRPGAVKRVRYIPKEPPMLRRRGLFSMGLSAEARRSGVEREGLAAQIG